MMQLTEYHNHIPADFGDHSRVWIYQSDRAFTDEEVIEIQDKLNEFNEQWNAHGSKVKSHTAVFFNRFIVLMTDGDEVEVSGCSIDSSTNFIKTLEQGYKVDLFNRQNLAFVVDDAILSIRLSDLNNSIQLGKITPQTMYFNNTIDTKYDLLHNWIVPIENTWLKGQLRITN